MNTWIVHWSMNGWTEVEARSRDEAMARVEELSSTEMLEMGDHELPEVYWAEERMFDFPAPQYREVRYLTPHEQYL